MHWNPLELAQHKSLLYDLKVQNAVSVDRTRDLQIFSLTLSQLSYPRMTRVIP